MAGCTSQDDDTASNPTIKFEDSVIESICIRHFDLNNDSKLSYEEAAAVKDLGMYFSGNESIKSFDELQFFIGLTELKSNCFDECRQLQKITIPDNVVHIGTSAFSCCSSLRTITLPKNLRTVSEDCFSECSDLVSVIIPDGVSSIGSFALADCTSLSSIVLPESVISLGNIVLSGCSSLKSIVLESTYPPSIHDDTFSMTNNCPIYVPANSLDLYVKAWPQYSERIKSK